MSTARVRHYPYKCDGGAWHGTIILLSTASTSVMMIRGERGRYRVTKKSTKSSVTDRDPGIATWESC